MSLSTPQAKGFRAGLQSIARITNRSLLRGVLPLLGLVLAGPAAHAQLDTSTIRGLVTDRSGAVVPGTTVVIRDLNTNRTFTTTTRAGGEYSAPSLSVSVYRITFTMKGFKTTTIDKVVLHANQTLAENATLDVGAEQQVIEVRADGVEVDTDTSGLGTTITADQVAKLPLNGRDFTALLALVPGAVQNTGDGVNRDSLGGFASGQFGANMLVDGTDSTRVDSNTTFSTFGRGNARITRSSVDNIQEVKILSSAYSAEYGRAIGEIVNVITKSGTNQLHGEVFEFFRNDALDAKNYFYNGTPTPLRLNQFGGNLGGPIAHDKLFFFTNYEGVRQHVTTPVTGMSLVLNDRMRATAAPSMAPILAKIPRGNGGPAPTVNHVVYSYWFDVLNGATSNDIQEDTAALKLDYVLSRRNNFSVRYNYNSSNTYGVYGLAIDQHASAPQLSQLGKATWNYTGSQSFLNEAGFAINSPHSHQDGGEPGFPIFGCFFCSVGFGVAPSPQLFSSRQPAISYQAIDTATKILGRHQLRFGTDIRWNNVGRELDQQDMLFYSGGPTVEAATDLPCNGQPQGTNGCVDPSGGPEGFLGNSGLGWIRLGYPLTHMKNVMMAYFLNDEWKVRPNLALNVGIRWEHNTVLHAQEGNVQNFDIATLSLLPASTPFYQPSYVDWAPRVGFNWDPTGKGVTSVKGGFGLFFLPISPGSPLNLAANTHENLSINLLQIAFGGVVCTPPLTVIQYPLPAGSPDCNPKAPSSVTAFDRHQRDSYSEQWNLAVEQQIARNSVLTLSYRGNRGLRLNAGGNLNMENPKTGHNYLSDSFGGITFAGQYAKSSYNALSVSMHTDTHGLSLQANYNWMHEFDNVMGLFEAYQNPYDIQADFSPGDIDIRNSFSIGMVYSVPHLTRNFPALTSGWQVTALVQGRSGSPVNLGWSENNPFTGSLRPDCNFEAPTRAANYRLPGPQYNAAAFSAPAGNFGNCPRNYVRGPGFFQPDLGLVKNTKLGDRLTWELRGEFFNVVNHPNFSNPGGTVNGFSFGTSYATVGSLVGLGTSRQVQLSTKLIF
ncbi:MAG: TonB-dependent receptor [Acidobacteria bacterium]|nr:TonB-dependent receptor [Acidobacteriota bacterium]